MLVKRLVIVVPGLKKETKLKVPWRQMYEIALQFNNMGVKTAIATSDIQKETIEGIPIINLKQKEIRILNEESKKQIMDFSPDLIYWMGNPYSGTYLKKSGFDIPLVLHISTLPISKKEWQNFSFKELFSNNRLQFLTSFFPFNRIFLKLNNSSITGIISSSKTITDRLIQLGIKESKINTSPLFFEPNFKISQKNIEEKFSVCYAGPLSTERGSMLILKAIRILKSRGKKINLLFLLRTKKYEEKEIIQNEIQKLDLIEDVNLVTGVLKPEEFLEYISSSKIVTIPTKYVWNEPPVTILEAMLVGKPVITSNVCGLPEMVADNAITVNPRPEIFANELEKLVDNTEKQLEIGLKGQKYASSLPGWESLAKWTLNSLKEVLDKETRGNKN